MARVDRGKLIRFVLTVTIVAGVWMIILPWIARQPAEYDRWNALQQAGIDPSAMYYPELEAMRPILERLNRAERPSPAIPGR